MAREREKYQGWLRFSAMGLELGLAVIVGLLLGQWLDSRFGTDPWLTLLFLIFGMVAGFRSVYRLLREVTAQQRNERRPGADQDDDRKDRP